MKEATPPTDGESEAISEWIERYEPRLLTASQRQYLLPALRHLVLAAEFATLNHAKVAMSHTARFVADMAAPEATDLDEVLTELNLSAWSHSREGQPAPSGQGVSDVRRLLHLHQGLDRVPQGPAAASEAPPSFSRSELEVLVSVAGGSEDATRTLVAVVGAGLWGPETHGAQIAVVDGEPRVVLASGACRAVDPTLLEVLTGVVAGPVRMDNWRKLTRLAARSGVKLTQYRARDAWAMRVLAEPRSAVEIICDLGIRECTLTALASLIELPDPEAIRTMLRGQPCGDWHDANGRHPHPQSAIHEAGPEVKP